MVMNSKQKRYDLLADPVLFVTASKDVDNHERTVTENKADSSLTGEEAKRIYEEILKERLQKPTKPTCSLNDAACIREQKPILIPTAETYSPITIPDFFRAAQDGEVEKVNEYISTNGDNLNVTDGYSWTALMMAAHAGHREVVLVLLSNGALWMDLIDDSGYDARDLACIGGHPELAPIFTNSENHVKRWKLEKFRREVAPFIKRERIWCETCKMNFYASHKNVTPDPHYTSTLHLFNDKDRSVTSSSNYYISRSNIGFQMMEKEGWDGESGLGPSGLGQKYPVKTILKRDRLGFGEEGKKRKAKVTHFGAHDKLAIRRERKRNRNNREFSARTKLKNLVSRKKAEQRDKEKDFRRAFY